MWLLGPNATEFIEEDSWSPNASQPSTWITENSSPVGPRESETEADCMLAAGGAQAILDFTKKERDGSIPSSPTWQEQLIHHFQIAQASTTHPSFLLHRKSWVLVLFMQQIYALQLKDYWQQPKYMGSEEKYDGKPIAMSIPVLKGLRE